jgi:hypothetical protein
MNKKETACRHCSAVLYDTELAHEDEHPGLCCDCYDLSFGMPLEAINAERAERMRAPAPPWRPGNMADPRVARDAHSIEQWTTPLCVRCGEDLELPQTGTEVLPAVACSKCGQAYETQVRLVPRG